MNAGLQSSETYPHAVKGQYNSKRAMLQLNYY